MNHAEALQFLANVAGWCAWGGLVGYVGGWIAWGRMHE